jgi:hypothetical protein
VRKCAEYLPENKIYQAVTVAKNRIGLGTSMLGDDKGLKRGKWVVTVRGDENLCIVKWKDNIFITLLPSCIGSEPVGTCKR